MIDYLTHYYTEVRCPICGAWNTPMNVTDEEDGTVMLQLECYDCEEVSHVVTEAIEMEDTRIVKGQERYAYE